MPKVSKKQEIKFDPTKNYRWKPEDLFEFNGEDFSFLIQYFTRVATGNVVAPIDTMRGYNMLQEILKEAVEQGVATEMVDEAPLVQEVEEVK